MSDNGNGNGNGSKPKWAMESCLIDPSKGQGQMSPQFPGYMGLPFRGVPMDRKEDDPEHLQPQVAANVHVEILDMSDEEDRKKMAIIYQMMVNGFATISVEERQWVPEEKTWRVFLRWADVYAYNPQKGHTNGRTE